MNINILRLGYLTYAAHWLAGLFMMASLGLASAAWAHSNEYLATIKGPHGGMLRMVDMYHLELVMKPGEAHVWVTDHGDTPQPTKGAIATLRVIDGNDAFSVYLKPTSGNGLTIKDARIKARKGTRLILMLSMNGEALETRFSFD